MLSNWGEPKRKRDLPDYEEEYSLLAEDGKLVDWPEENHAELRKNKRSG